jgi:hypothetical protein
MDRKRVFKLMMMGRISAAEAERLMAVWQAGRESAWILFGCLVFGVAAQLNAGASPVVQHLVHELRVTEWVRMEWLHAVPAMVLRFRGGTQ